MDTVCAGTIRQSRTTTQRSRWFPSSTFLSMKTIVLSPETGNLPAWSEQEATRLSKLATFQPGGWTAVGSSRVYRKLNNTLRAVGIHGAHRETVSRDICDMARLLAGAN